MRFHGIKASQLIAAGKEFFDGLVKQGEVRVEKKVLLQVLQDKLAEDPSNAEMAEPLVYNKHCKSSAVLIAVSEIDINGIKVTKLASKVLAKQAGLSLDALSHWALVVVDRGDGGCHLYDLMSDQMLPATKVMKNYPRCFPVTEKMVQSWRSCSYIGETTRTHEEILRISSDFVSQHPRYQLFSNNCQHLAEELVRQLCNSKIISMQNLGDEAKMLSKRFSSTLLMKMNLDPAALEELKSDIKTAGDRLIAEKGSKIIR